MSQVIDLILAARPSSRKHTLKAILVRLLFLSAKIVSCEVFQYLMLVMVCVIRFFLSRRYQLGDVTG